jgi:uncharacterized protein YegP (UPF0339 family)
MAKVYRSKALRALHETMSDLHAAGSLTDDKMKDFDAMCLVAEGATRAAMRRNRPLSFVTHADTDRLWRWRMVDLAGRVVASSKKGFRTRDEAAKAAEDVKAALRSTLAA